MRVQRLRDRLGKSIAVDGQRTAGGHLVGVGGAHDQGTQTAHFGVQQPDRVIGGIVRAEGIGADQFGEAVGAMRFRHSLRAHLMQHHPDAGPGDLPGGFGTGEAAANDVDRGLAARSWSVPVMGTEVARSADTTTPAAGRALSDANSRTSGSAIISPGCDTRDVRAIKTNIGQFAIAELGQFRDIALIVPERLDHADDR